MDSAIAELEERINKLSSVKILSKRLKKSSNIKGDICKLEKDLNDLSIKLDTLNDHTLDQQETSDTSDISDTSDTSDTSETKIDINKITARISETKGKIDTSTDIAERVKLYIQMKDDIEKCKKYYSCVKLAVKNLN